MPKILEKDMETAIEADLIKTGYFKREPSNDDKSLCLDPELLINFIIATQKEKWEAYQKQLGNKAKDALLAKIKDEIEKRGTLELLRKPFASYGIYFDFAYFCLDDGGKLIAPACLFRKAKCPPSLPSVGHSAMPNDTLAIL